MKKRIGFVLCLLASYGGAQSLNWDSSGNQALNGTYNFREVTWIVANQRGDLNEAISIYGSVTFDGNGKYTMSCQFMDSSVGAVQNCPALTGVYQVNAGGIARISSPQGDVLEGMVTNGVLVASTTEYGYNDLLFAAQQPGSAPNNSTLNGKYWVGNFDTPSGNITAARDSLFSANFDGAGNLDSVQATGYIGNSTNAATQSIGGVRYSFSNGVGTLAFGGTLSATNLLAGNRQFYVSPDGNFFFGGSTTGWDMLIGIRAPTSAAKPEDTNSLYYAAGIKSDQAELSQDTTIMQSFYSSFLANGSFEAAHQRVLYPGNQIAYDYTFTEGYTLAADGTYDENKNNFRYVVSDGGTYQLGFGKGPNPGITFSAKASFSGSGVFVNPGLILNAASFVPSSNGVSRGELVTISGTNLSNTSVLDGTFPTSLAGVLVLVNGRQAPIYEVSPTRITIQIPFTTTEPTATVQVISNGQASASVMLYNNTTSPGVFLVNGVYAAALHADYSLVTPDKPAVQGETIQVYVTGLGDITPAVNAGTPAPSDPLSRVSNTVSAVIDKKEGTAAYIGLAPGLVGLYQINVTVPSGISAGDVRFDLSTPDAFQTSALLPVAPAIGQ